MIELLVVIGIIALLLALLFPVLSKMHDSAKVVTCASNLRQIVLLMQIYGQGNDGRPPYQELGVEDWSGALTSMARSGRVFICPADDNPRRDTFGANTIRSYGVNCGPFTPIGGTPMRAPWPTMPDTPPARLHQVPSHVFIVGDNRGQYPQSAAWVGIAEAEGLDGIAWGTHRLKSGRGDNYGFSDAHVEYRLKQELDWFSADPDPALEGGPQDPWKWR